MKKIDKFLSVFFVTVLVVCSISNKGMSSPLGIGISFSAKAYWDGETKSCLPREKGCCFHIDFTINVSAPNKINGTLEVRQNNELAFSFSKSKGILPETYKELLKNGYFTLNGEGTFSDDILKQLGLPSSFRLSGGNYPYLEKGDVVTVTFKY